MSISMYMYRAYISMVIVFRTYGCTSFLSSFNNESVMFVNREKKKLYSCLEIEFRVGPIIIYVMNNLVNPRAWWQCSIKITVLFVGRCLPGKFHQVESAYFRSFNVERCLLEVALNQILYR